MPRVHPNETEQQVLKKTNDRSLFAKIVRFCDSITCRFFATLEINRSLYETMTLKKNSPVETQ